VEELPAAAEGPGYEVLSGPRGVADDLTKLHHVSPTIEKKLNDLGVFHYWQIAGLGPEAAHKIAEEVGLPGRVEGWIAQSKELTAE
jgi:small subunit ribosomal protein S2